MASTTSTRPAGAAPAPAADSGVDPAVLTPGRRAARASTTKEAVKPSLRERLVGTKTPASQAAEQPFKIISYLRFALATLLSVLCLATAGGALLMLMAWRQDHSTGLLRTQTERMWDAWDVLADIERWIAYLSVPIAVVWLVLAAVNVRRATARKRNPIFPPVALVVGVVGVWALGDQVVSTADDWVAKAAGIALQAVFLVLPLVAVERLVDAAEGAHRPFRVAFVMATAYLVTLQTAGALSTIDRTTELDGWGRTGGYLVIAALLEALGTIALLEGCRALEEGTQNRFELRKRFGESVLAAAGI